VRPIVGDCLQDGSVNERVDQVVVCTLAIDDVRKRCEHWDSVRGGRAQRRKEGGQANSVGLAYVNQLGYVVKRAAQVDKG
jgi:hypothetical protein